MGVSEWKHILLLEIQKTTKHNRKTAAGENGDTEPVHRTLEIVVDVVHLWRWIVL
jgi:hypothetical protein